MFYICIAVCLLGSIFSFLLGMVLGVMWIRDQLLITGARWPLRVVPRRREAWTWAILSWAMFVIHWIILIKHFPL